ncbi:MAG: hypothetical protein HZB50_12545 [Chloroflexi bacterium]|nr:hypothetical protein [Chloroflexota bacterium]
MKRMLFLIGFLLFFLTGCNLATSAPTVAPAFTPTPTQTATPAPTSTPVPVEFAVRVNAELVNCRFGPGTVYVLLNEFHRDQSLRAVGRNDPSTWLVVRDPGNPGGFCWVSASVVETQGQVSELSVKPPPFVTVTDVILRAEPNHIQVNCTQFPQNIFFEAQVTANGPTLLTWKWEASTGITSETETMIFQESGTQVINHFYLVGGANDYWMKLHILTPNETIKQVNIPVSCIP